jgi:hypothetical protein
MVSPKNAAIRVSTQFRSKQNLGQHPESGHYCSAGLG